MSCCSIALQASWLVSALIRAVLSSVTAAIMICEAAYLLCKSKSSRLSRRAVFPDIECLLDIESAFLYAQAAQDVLLTASIDYPVVACRCSLVHRLSQVCQLFRRPSHSCPDHRRRRLRLRQYAPLPRA